MDVHNLSIYKEGSNIAYIIDIFDYANHPKRVISLKPNDINSLKTSLKFIGYEVTDKWCTTGAFTKSSMVDFLKSIILTRFPDNIGSVILFISGHGNKTGVETTDGYSIEYDDIIDCFAKNASLRGKLKWFIFACCHGAKGDKVSKTVKSNTSSNNVQFPTQFHSFKDVFITFEAPLGYIAYEGNFVDAIKILVDNLKQQQKHQISLTEFSISLNKTMVEKISKVYTNIY